MTQALTNAWTHFQLAAQTREQDAEIRRQTPGIAIVDLTKLMTDMANDIPAELRTRRERQAYLQAVRDIAWHARESALEHGLIDGALYPCPRIIQGVHSAAIDQEDQQQ